jgi:hypothetical protein
MTKKFIKNVIGLALITTSTTYATSSINIDETENKTYETICYSNTCMSTSKLQEEVERLSVEGKLPFEMGLELIKRWSDNKIS